MNDRFRFRAFYKPHNKIYNVICLNSDKQKEIIIEHKGSTAIVEWKNCDILQCTGLKDKNGKLIYEGDIVKQGDAKYVVNWLEGTFCFKGLKTLHNFTIEYVVPSKQEVIGNIYENEDLLNENS